MNRIEQLIEELCPDGVEWKSLGEVSSIFDGTHQTPNYTNEGIKFVSVENISALYETKKYISTVDYDRLYRVKPQLNDIFMTRIGTIGACAIVDRNDDLAFYVTLTLIRPLQDIVNSKFIKYIIESSKGQKELRKRTLIYAVPIKINLGDIGKIRIPIPPLPIQQEIVRILDTFTNLDAELQAELEARKKQYEHYRNQLLNFEGKEVEWKTLGEVTYYPKSRISVIEVDEDNYVGVENLLQNKQGKTLSNYVPKSGNLIEYKRNDVLIGNIRPYLKKIWLATNNGGTNGDVVVIRICSKPDALLRSKFLYCILSSDAFFDYHNQFAKGGKMPRGDKNQILKFNIPIPPLPEQERIVSILDKFEALVNVELPAEIAARRRQYEYYREKLLTFKKVD